MRVDVLSQFSRWDLCDWDINIFHVYENNQPRLIRPKNIRGNFAMNSERWEAFDSGAWWTKQIWLRVVKLFGDRIKRGWLYFHIMQNHNYAMIQMHFCSKESASWMHCHEFSYLKIHYIKSKLSLVLHCPVLYLKIWYSSIYVC